MDVHEQIQTLEESLDLMYKDILEERSAFEVGVLGHWAFVVGYEIAVVFGATSLFKTVLGSPMDILADVSVATRERSRSRTRNCRTLQRRDRNLTNDDEQCVRGRRRQRKRRARSRKSTSF